MPGTKQTGRRTGRPKGATGGYNKRTRGEFVEKIQVGKVIAKLQKHVFGEVEMSQTQIRAAEILLKKTIPDLAAGTLDFGEETLGVLRDVSATERAARLTFFLEQRGLKAAGFAADGQHADMDAAAGPPDGSLLQ